MYQFDIIWTIENLYNESNKHSSPNNLQQDIKLEIYNFKE